MILAPFGLAGTLTGQSFRAIDPHTLRLLEGWRHFYPIDKGLGESSDLPPFVEVLVGKRLVAVINFNQGNRDISKLQNPIAYLAETL